MNLKTIGKFFGLGLALVLWTIAGKFGSAGLTGRYRLLITWRSQFY
jgi:hypothetical protein